MGAREGTFVAEQHGGGVAVVGEFLEDERDTVLDDGFGELGIDIFPAADELHFEYA